MVSGSLKTNKLLLQGDGVGDVTLDVNNNSFRMRMGGEDLMTVEGSMGSVVPGIDDTLLTITKDTKFDGNVQIGNISNVENKLSQIERKSDWFFLDNTEDDDETHIQYKAYLPKDYQFLNNIRFVRENPSGPQAPLNNFPKHDKYPALIMLHSFELSEQQGLIDSAAEGARIIDLVNRQGPLKNVTMNTNSDKDFIYISLQLRGPGGNLYDVEPIRKVILEVLDRYPIDPKRIYMGSVSVGSHALYTYLDKYRDNPLVAATVSTSPAPHPFFGHDFSNTSVTVPSWNFWASNDNNIWITGGSDVQFSWGTTDVPPATNSLTALKNNSNGNVKNSVFERDLSKYTDDGVHFGCVIDVWNGDFINNAVVDTYDDFKTTGYNDVYDWLLSHNLGDNTTDSEIESNITEAKIKIDEYVQKRKLNKATVLASNAATENQEVQARVDKANQDIVDADTTNADFATLFDLYFPKYTEELNLTLSTEKNNVANALVENLTPPIDFNQQVIDANVAATAARTLADANPKSVAINTAASKKTEAETARQNAENSPGNVFLESAALLAESAAIVAQSATYVASQLESTALKAESLLKTAQSEFAKENEKLKLSEKNSKENAANVAEQNASDLEDLQIEAKHSADIARAVANANPKSAADNTAAIEKSNAETARQNADNDPTDNFKEASAIIAESNAAIAQSAADVASALESDAVNLEDAAETAKTDAETARSASNSANTDVQTLSAEYQAAQSNAAEKHAIDLEARYVIANEAATAARTLADANPKSAADNTAATKKTEAETARQNADADQGNSSLEITALLSESAANIAQSNADVASGLESDATELESVAAQEKTDSEAARSVVPV